MKKLFILFASILAFNSCSQETGITKIKDVAVFEKIVDEKDIQLIDVRRTAEYEKGSIGNAMHMNVLQEKDFLSQIETLDKNEPVYLFCHSGKRSKKAAKILKEKGFKEIFDFSPGYKGWSAVKSKN